MNYTPKEIINFVEENDVKFIRLSFTDIYGNLKNIAIMPSELVRAFEYGIPFESGFFSKKYSDLLLFPDISTLSVLPWRPKSGRVIRFFCNIKHTDGTNYIGDLRKELIDFTEKMSDEGYSAKISTRCEFYLFNTDENGMPTRTPHDNAGYLDIAPLDKCENARREICLSLEEMGFNPQTSKHSYGPGQNEIDFKRSNPITAADNMVYYKTVVKNVASQHGLFASFMPKPIENCPGSGLHIGLSIKKDNKHIFSSQSDTLTEDGRNFIAGVLNRISQITCFLNPTTNSYKRLCEINCPDNKYNNCSQLMRIPYTYEQHPCIELRSADAACNPYIAFRLILGAGFEGIRNKEVLEENVFSDNIIFNNNMLPESLSSAVAAAGTNDFLKSAISDEIYKILFNHFDNVINKYDCSENKNKFENDYYFNII